MNSESRNMSQFAITLSILFAIILAFVPKLTSANDGFSTTSRNVYLGFELVTLVIFAAIAVLNLQANKRLGRSIISVPFIYIFAGLGILILSRLFLLAHRMEFFTSAEMVVGIYWHAFVYLSLVCFFIAVRKISARTSEKVLSPIGLSDYTIITILLLASLFFMFTSESIGTSIMKAIMKTPIPEYGLLHFLAFFLTGLLTLDYLRVQRKTKETSVGRYMDSISSPFLLFLFVTTLNHLTALLTESWAVLDIPHTILDPFNQSLWLLGFAILLVGYIKLGRTISKTVEGPTSTITEASTTISQTVMAVLRDHIGSLANQIANQSSTQVNIPLDELSEDNISVFAESIESNTSELIGKFPSRFLKLEIIKSVKSGN